MCARRASRSGDAIPAAVHGARRSGAGSSGSARAAAPSGAARPWRSPCGGGDAGLSPAAGPGRARAAPPRAPVRYFYSLWGSGGVRDTIVLNRIGNTVPFQLDDSSIRKRDVRVRANLMGVIN